MNNIADKLQDAVTEINILDDAIDFVRHHSIDSVNSKNKNLCEILYVIKHFSAKVATDITNLELIMKRG